MNVITTILSLAILASSIAVLVGLVMLLFRSRRRKGAWLATGSAFSALVCTAALGGVLGEGLADASSGKASAPLALESATDRVETASAATAPSSDGQAITTASQLRNNAEAIARWCEMKAAQRTLSQQRDAELDANLGEKARKEITGRYDALQRDLTVNLASQLGIKEWELNKLSMSAPWPTYCRANSKGWAVVAPELAAATSRSDAKEALAALRGFYEMNLKGNRSSYFDNSRYAAVTCRRKAVDGLHLVGCILQSFSNPSSWDVFVVGRLQNGQLAVAPIDGEASDHITSVGDLKSFQAPYAPEARLAEFAGQVDQSAVDELFD
ncbi:hypothetical protein J4717_11495 [Phaeobacter sp. HS012]|uniref:hypothetical protein n=1 Tax=unclassified Phaeobacter TaxID=2621772 RepID=UPI001B368B48|nr:MULTISPECIES: hypothetical protein [unclassified Phaeobacter]MBQ4808092.1 hypothetical protein [Phaeobacter sp. HS012]MBQ4882941.1 hypothetical protein [Phaeobacter sp. HS011]